MSTAKIRRKGLHGIAGFIFEYKDGEFEFEFFGDYTFYGEFPNSTWDFTVNSVSRPNVFRGSASFKKQIEDEVLDHFRHTPPEESLPVDENNLKFTWKL